MDTPLPFDGLADAPEGVILNRVAESAIATVDLAALWDGGTIAELDIEPFLYRGLVLRERDFRQAVKDADWSVYADRHVAVFCSTDAIVPPWAFMVIAARLDGVARSVAAGRAGALVRDAYVRALDAHDWSVYANRPVVLKGCSDTLAGTDGATVPLDAFLVATQKLQAVAAKLMYGEPCSSVPVWRRPAAPTPAGATPSRMARPAARPTGPGGPAPA